MTRAKAQFDDDCDIPLRPRNDTKDMIVGFVLCAAMGIGFAALSVAPLWLIITIALVSLPFTLKSIKE